MTEKRYFKKFQTHDEYEQYITGTETIGGGGSC